MQLAQLAVGLVGVFDRVVWMHASGREQNAGSGAGDLKRLPRTLATGAGHDQLHDTRRLRPGQHRIEVVGETFVAEISADIDEFHGSILAEPPNPGL